MVASAGRDSIERDIKRAGNGCTNCITQCDKVITQGAVMSEASKEALLYRIFTHPALLLVAGFIYILGLRLLIEVPAQLYLPPVGRSDWEDLTLSCIISASGVLGLWFIITLWGGERFSDFGLQGCLREWGLGIAIGAGAMSAVVAVIAMLGGYQIIGRNGPDILVGVLSMAIISGVWEEILLRGIVFRYLEKWLGSMVALALSAVLFGVMHIANPNASWLAAYAIAIEAGIMLGAIYMLTRRLWAAIGLHMAWNTVQGGVFGVAVSGTEVKGLLVSKSSGSDLLSGGGFGAEASLPAIFICTSIGLFILWRAKQKGQVIAPSVHRFKTGEAAAETPVL
jgi:uncharacterized protein